MQPLIKWPGGKSGEIRQIEPLIPTHKRYIEPFFGGGALFFHLQPQNSVINDISTSLMEFYSLLKEQSQQLRHLLICYGKGFENLIALCEQNYQQILDLYTTAVQNRWTKAHLTTQLPNSIATFTSQILEGLSPDLQVCSPLFLEHIYTMAADKMARTIINNNKQTFSDEDLKSNLITGFASGYYMYFRKIYNDLHLQRLTTPSPAYKAANFYFIREYCYGSMFRYNHNGEFNIPYGGISYNRKNFLLKVDNMFSPQVANTFKNTQICNCDFEEFFKKVHLCSDDFIFLDPPYDTDFSDYEGRDFTWVDQERLAAHLKKTPAQFMMVIKNTDFIYSLYKDDFHIHSFNNQYAYNVRSRNQRSVEHLIITNFPVKPTQL